jgi:hypothetical protein
MHYRLNPAARRRLHLASSMSLSGTCRCALRRLFLSLGLKMCKRHNRAAVIARLVVPRQNSAPVCAAPPSWACIRNLVLSRRNQRYVESFDASRGSIGHGKPSVALSIKVPKRVRRAEGAGLDRECADRATIIVAATRKFRPARPSTMDFYFAEFPFVDIE